MPRVKSNKLFKDQFYTKASRNSRYGKATLNLDAEGLINKIAKTQEEAEALTKDKGLVETLADTLTAVSADYIPYRDEYRIKKNKRKLVAIRKPKKEEKYRESLSKKNIKIHTITTTKRGIIEGKKSDPYDFMKEAAFKRFKTRTVRDKNGKVLGFEKAERDEMWNGLIWAGARKTFTPAKVGKITERKTKKYKVTDADSGVDVYDYRYEDTVDTRYNKRGNHLSSKYDDGYHAEQIWSEKAHRYYYRKSDKYISEVKTIESKNKEGKPYSRQVEYYYADRPPHLNELVSTVKVVKYGNKYIAKFKYSIHKPKDEAYVNNPEGTGDYGAIQYFGIDSKGKVKGDAGWSRQTDNTTSRWLEASVGALSTAEASKYQGVPASEAKGNYDTLVRVVQDALRKRMRK